ncbi:MAG TPA: hypothetical protein VEI54_00060 [Candidatus Limnocylindrales bacterium]|nr:hypothetical protein [Candidatus Limnocylindrales bacterium]
MYRLAFLFLLAIAISPEGHAQKPESEIACYAGQEGNAPHKKKLWDGYEISLGPVAHPEETELQCTAAIYKKAGKVVFRTSGFNVVFDEELTGEDFDGDGKPEVVFRTDTGGGVHCCWGYIVVSPSPRPHKLFEMPIEGKVDFEKSKDGKMVMWERTSAPGGFFTSMAGRPFAEKVFRMLDGKLTDVTADFCGTNDPRFERGDLTPEDLKKLAHAGEQGQDELENIISTLESRTAQHVFCGEYDEALKDLNLWPEGKREVEIRTLRNAFWQEYPEFVAKLPNMPKKSG